MKKLLFSAVLLLACVHIWAQGFNYQAIARNQAGAVLSNRALVVEIAIYGSQLSNNALYMETHGVTTNPYGLFTLIVGKGLVRSGSFENIDWSPSGHFLGVKITLGTTNIDLGRTALQVVPYSKFANVARKAIDTRLSDLTDVGSNTPTLGQVLSWNGSIWGPATPSGALWSVNGVHTFYNGGNVGIGVNNPQNLLHVHNSNPLFGSPSTLHLTNSNSGAAASDGLSLTLNSTVADYGLMGGLLMRENASLGLGANNAYHLFLKPTGLLGLGTFNPQGKLDIQHNSSATSPHLMISEDEASYGRINFRSIGVSNKYWTIAARTQASDPAAQFNFYYHNGTTGQDILSINGNGHVGVGTVAPARPLHIHTNNTSLNTGNLYLTQAGTGDALMHIGLTGGAHYNLGIDNSDNDEFKISYNATQPGAVNQGNLMSLDKDGNLGIKGKMTRPEVAGSANLLPIAYGTINANGTIAHGSDNFGIQKSSQGVYEIKVVGITLNKSTTTAIVSGQQISYLSYSINAAGSLLVRTATIFSTVNPVGPTGTAADYDFSFVIYMQ